MTSPTHPKAPAYLQRGIFDGLKNFRELEARISALATAQERGDAFEVFAEAYLATVAVEKAKQVWSGARVPPSVRKRLALTIGDNGVDGIFETPLGETHAYQAKFRTSRPSLTWDELSTFLGLADRVDQRVLITNCDRFAGLVKERTAFYAITGNDLDKLEPPDFAALRAWLAGAQVERTRKTPLHHQAEASDRILAALREHDRATALMACGTGKTLVALWVAERLCVRNILVLVPSLALLGQTLHEWARETSWPALAHLCVCSDPAVQAESDEIILRSSDLDFPVTTDSAGVREFLAASYAGVKLVFSTYQSAHVVAAGMKPGESFDLAIFDEAHKTAGREGVHFGFPLSDKNLPIKKRLFLTATPRHYDLRRRDREGDARLVYSMDAPEIYGPVAHQLTFAEAARRGLICHYRVIISVVTTGMVNDHLLRHGEVLVQGDAVQARHVASQLALQAAVAEHGVGKIFTFHRSVASAAAFTGDGAAGIGNHLPGFAAFHVNGTMPMSERNGIMREFRAASRAVISNARCLTEGVDVPAVDMVAFLTPKRSRVDIVQATGRAMRKAAGKTTGYVLVPLFVEQAKGETIGEALARTEFDEVWNVLQAMQEQDETLAEIIRQMREERGRTKGFDDTRFRERVELLGPQISLETLRDSITTACVEVLGDNWEERFGQLKAFKDRYGHCDVQDKLPEHRQLSAWVSWQRYRHKSGRLPETHLGKLITLGFIWDTRDLKWSAMFDALIQYKSHFGHCNVPLKWLNNPALARWVSQQRQLKRTGRLGADRIKRLEILGFEWELIDAAWREMFATLVTYRDKFGDCQVPQKWPENSRLGSWVGNLRSLKRSGTLNEQKIAQLESVGFVWEPLDATWEQRFTELNEFKHQFGHCNVPAKWHENQPLGTWVSVLRGKRATVSPERVRRLVDLGFVWDAIKAAWEEQFAKVVRYKVQYGHCNVPARWKEDSSLATWVRSRRRDKQEGVLSKEHIQRLDAIGFVWDRFSASWEEMFTTLVEFKNQHGHCRVPSHCADNPELGQWVTTQRSKRDRLTEDRIRRLNEIGFQWKVKKGPKPRGTQ